MQTRIKPLHYLYLFLLAFATVMYNPIANAQHVDPEDFVGPDFFDTYHEIWNQQDKWSIYNVHDPTVFNAGDEFIMYSTDVSMGGGTPVGLHKRRSQDLVNWTFEGTAFDGPPDSAIEWMLEREPGFQAESLWAPYLLQVGDEYRLYYSLSLFGTTTSFMGLAVSDSPLGPWTDMGEVLSTEYTDNKNAIDPSVVVDVQTGQHWMAYGSYWTGIYIVELDPETGYRKNPGDYGVNVARRAGNSIEGPELFYRDGWYYLFVSYGWLEDSYNIRVGRSMDPQGPYYDFNGVDMVEPTNNTPLILRPYRFNHHVGWQGTGHCAVFRDGDRYFIANQGRPSTSIFNMVLHLREIFWIDDWPVVSPQRFADVPEWEIAPEDITGEWEHMTLGPGGFHARPDIISFDTEGTIGGSDANTWSLSGDTLIMSWSDGQYIDKLIVHWGWDWENRFVTLLYTGMNQNGLNIWGKKTDPDVIDALTVPEHGSTYFIRNHHSNKLLEAQAAEIGANIRQMEDTGSEDQEWVLIDAGDGHFQLSPVNGQGLVMEVANANPDNFANIRLGHNEIADHQLWELRYLDNGYFALLSKVSGEERCADVSNFGIHNGANIMQWEFLNGMNQMWRLERKQTGLDPDLPLALMHPKAEQAQINVYPNPVINGHFTLDLGSLQITGNIDVVIADTRGSIVYRTNMKGGEIQEVYVDLDPGIYFISISGSSVSEHKRIIVM